MANYDYRTDLQKVRDLRERLGCGIDEAKAIVMRDNLRREIGQIENLEDVRRVLREAFPSLGGV